MGKSGKGKSSKGKPETNWAELKSRQLKTMITPTAKELLPNFLKQLGLNLSEFVEYLVRGYFKLEWRTFTIAELVSAADLDELAEESSLRRDYLEAIAKGMEPSATAIIRLGGLLTPPIPNAKPLSSEELRQIWVKTFPSSDKVGNGHGNEH